MVKLKCSLILVMLQLHSQFEVWIVGIKILLDEAHAGFLGVAGPGEHQGEGGLQGQGGIGCSLLYITACTY